MDDKEINNLVYFTEVKERLIDMYNFNKDIKVELKPIGVKAILDYIDSKDKELERLNNIIDTISEMFERDENFEDGCYCYEIEKYVKELKGSDNNEK